MGLRTLADLVDVERPAWPVIRGLITDATADVQILDLSSPSCGADTLVNLQVTAGSFLGGLALHCGGLLVDHGWLRLLGGGSPDLPDLATANGLPARDLRPPGRLVVGYDVLGGTFAVNGSELPGQAGEVCYFGPDTLEWTPLGLPGHSVLLEWALAGGLADTFADLRWKGWQDEAAAAGSGYGIGVYPPLWSEQARPLDVNGQHHPAPGPVGPARPLPPGPSPTTRRSARGQPGEPSRQRLTTLTILLVAVGVVPRRHTASKRTKSHRAQARYRSPARHGRAMSDRHRFG